MRQSPRQEFQTVQNIIQNRRTKKILAQSGPVEFDATLLKEGERTLWECIASAGMAPFHYDRGRDCLAEPWRIHVLSNSACRQLAKKLPELISLKPSSKLPCLLDGCCQLVLVNWIPVDPKNPGSLSESKIRQVNLEHLSAASAFTQNLLLLTEALGWDGYWGSGGMLGSHSVLDFLGIGSDQEIAAAVYITFQKTEEIDSDRKVLSGKMHPKRSPWRNWTRLIDLQPCKDK